MRGALPSAIAAIVASLVVMVAATTTALATQTLFVAAPQSLSMARAKVRPETTTTTWSLSSSSSSSSWKWKSEAPRHACRRAFGGMPRCSARYDMYDGSGGKKENATSIRNRFVNAAILESIFSSSSSSSSSPVPSSSSSSSSSYALSWMQRLASLSDGDDNEAIKASGKGRRRDEVPKGALVDLVLAGRGDLVVRSPSSLYSSVDNGDGDDDADEGASKNREEKAKEEEEEKEESIPCLFLSLPSDSDDEDDDDDNNNDLRLRPLLPVPMPYPIQPRIRLLSFAYRSRPISKSLCLTLNPLLTNRDGTLWDNLPWSTWSVDPLLRNRDAAGNPIEQKYHLGKRDAYNRMMGKDWPGRSLSLTNLVAKAMYVLEGDMKDEENASEKSNDVGGGGGKGTEASFDDAAAQILARRVLELELREARSGLAESESYLALVRTQYGGGGGYDGGYNDDDRDEALLWSLPDNSDRWTFQSALDDVAGANRRVREAEEALRSLRQMGRSTTTTDAAAAAVGEDDEQRRGKGGDGEEVRSILSSFLNYLTDGKPKAPYRGAMGYAPLVDTKNDMFTKSTLPYTGPYDLLLEIISDQLNADVIGTVVENTSLFENRLVLGGAVVLKRRGVQKTVKAEGQTLVLDDEDDDLGNDGITAGATCVVECDVDEAVGMALAANVPVCAERDVWNLAKIDGCGVAVKRDGVDNGHDAEEEEEKEDNAKGVLESIPLVDCPAVRRGYDPNGGDGGSGNRLTPSAPPRPADAFADFFRPKPAGTTLFPTDNPITSLGQYDSLTVQDKARILLSLDSFNGKLPRPRVLRDASLSSSSSSSSSLTTLDPLDELLIPLVDESVRRRLLLRDAEARGDVALAKDLRAEESRRGRAKVMAELAKKAGRDEEAEAWEEQADFYADLRADVTQDEGAYSRFLDKDEWYERDRQARAKRLDKNKFGTLLDGTGLE